jgi:hypothetical protein
MRMHFIHRWVCSVAIIASLNSTLHWNLDPFYRMLWNAFGEAGFGEAPVGQTEIDETEFAEIEFSETGFGETVWSCGSVGEAESVKRWHRRRNWIRWNEIRRKKLKETGINNNGEKHRNMGFGISNMLSIVCYISNIYERRIKICHKNIESKCFDKTVGETRFHKTVVSEMELRKLDSEKKKSAIPWSSIRRN